MEKKKLSVYRSAQLFRNFLFDYRDQLNASVIVSGWDEQEGGQVKNFNYIFSLIFF